MEKTRTLQQEKEGVKQLKILKEKEKKRKKKREQKKEKDLEVAVTTTKTMYICKSRLTIL